MMELSNTCALSLSGVVSEEVSLCEGNGCKKLRYFINYQHGPAFDLADHDINLCHIGIKFLHEVLCDQVSPSLLIGGVLENGTEDIVED